MLHFVLADGLSGELALGHTGNLQRLHGGRHEALVDESRFLEGASFPLAEPAEAEQRARVAEAAPRGGAAAARAFVLRYREALAADA